MLNQIKNILLSKDGCRSELAELVSILPGLTSGRRPARWRRRSSRCTSPSRTDKLLMTAQVSLNCSESQVMRLPHKFRTCRKLFFKQDSRDFEDPELACGEVPSHVPGFQTTSQRVDTLPRFENFSRRGFGLSPRLGTSTEHVEAVASDSGDNTRSFSIGSESILS